MYTILRTTHMYDIKPASRSTCVHHSISAYYFLSWSTYQKKDIQEFDGFLQTESVPVWRKKTSPAPLEVPTVMLIQHYAPLTFSHSPDFWQQKLVLPVFVLYISGKIQHGCFVAGFFQTTSCLWDSSILLRVIVDHSFSFHCSDSHDLLSHSIVEFGHCQPFGYYG